MATPVPGLLSIGGGCQDETAAPADLPRFHPGRMNELAEQAGSDAIVRELVGLFLGDVAERLLDLRVALLAGDQRERERVAHSIKGSCANLGAERMAAMARLMEQSPAEPSLLQWEAMAAEFAELKAALGERYPAR